MTSGSTVREIAAEGRQPRRVVPRALQSLLGVPLPAKIAGANLLMVSVAAASAYVVRAPAADRSVLLMAAIALGAAVILNSVLVALALKPLRQLERTVWRVWAGKLESRVPTSHVADTELRRVSDTMNFLLDELARDRARARSLASAVVRAGDHERARVGRELHDSIAQSVAAIRFELLAIEQDVTQPHVAEKLRALRAGAGELLEEIKVLSLSTHPRILTDLGLVPALRHLARSLNVEPEVAVRVPEELEREPGMVPPEAAAVLYRVAQEAIANSIRHAAPTRIEITLGLADGTVTMQIDDDGVGFDVAAIEESESTAGLFAMRERTALVNGGFEIESVFGKGTSVRIRLPVSEQNVRRR